jgi:hypothetical protein
MLDFLWSGASKSGRQPPPTPVEAATEELDMTSKGQGQEALAECAVRPSSNADLDDAPVAGPEMDAPDSAASNPPYPPGGQAEFTADAANVQDEVAKTLDACAVAPDQHPSASESESRVPPPNAGGTARGQRPLLAGRRRGRRLVQPQAKSEPLTPTQRLLLLDTWQRSGLSAADFAALVGVSNTPSMPGRRSSTSKGPAGLWTSRAAALPVAACRS